MMWMKGMRGSGGLKPLFEVQRSLFCLHFPLFVLLNLDRWIFFLPTVLKLALTLWNLFALFTAIRTTVIHKPFSNIFSRSPPFTFLLFSLFNFLMFIYFIFLLLTLNIYENIFFKHIFLKKFSSTNQLNLKITVQIVF